jgi:hypothetical protein
MRHLRTAKLARWQVQLLSISGAVLWLTGAAWLLLHYFGRVQGQFGPQANPLEPWLLRLHGLTMIAALLGVGSLLVVHIRKGWNYRTQRVLGVVLSSAVGLLILSGYLLYYVGDEDLRNWVSIVHWAIGLGAPIAFILHYTRRRSLS